MNGWSIMINSFKRILLAMAKLPRADQRWIIKQLSPTFRETFEKYDGFNTLQKARQFRSLAIPEPCQKPVLPGYCERLAQKSPLYIAIVLEQGDYPWHDSFLLQYHIRHSIQSLLPHVAHIKLAVKQALFNEWEEHLSFESYLEEGCG